MPRICYDEELRVKLEAKPPRMAVIKMAVQIIAEYQAQGFDLTLRQLYYQFVARGYLENTQKAYAKLGNLIVDGRMAGFIDWTSIVDRTRNLRGLQHFDSPADMVDAMRHGFHISHWEGQPYRVEVWIEKDALLGVIAGVCTEYDVPYFSCRGYTSVSEVWGAAQRLMRYQKKGQKIVILHLGDHDPSGVDMSRDIKARLTTFGLDVEVIRIALNMSQIDRYKPPPNFAKLKDARAKKYIAKYGTMSWELDALEPQVLVRLIKKSIEKRLDMNVWAASQQAQVMGRQALHTVAKGMR